MISEKFFLLFLWFSTVFALLQSCLEGDGHGLDPNGYCHPVDSFSLSICPELCNPRNKDHVCYCDTTDINDTCLACDVTVPTETCYDSCQTKMGHPANPGKLILKDTCTKKRDTIVTGKCPKDPMNPCTSECAHLRTIDYTTQIAPIWESGQCKTSCHLAGGTAFNLTGHGRQVTVIYGDDTIKTQRFLSFEAKDKPIHRLINVLTWPDSTIHPIWRVRPFAPDSSYLYTILKGSGKNGNSQMPSGKDPISPASLAEIKKWIEEGACPEK